MPKPFKQVRFDDLVTGAGSPEQVTLWAKPEAGSPFMKAVAENRIATVVQHNTGTKKDFGVIGFETLPNATFLLFPKSLPYAAGTKIIGLKYDRLSQAEPKGPLYKPAPQKPPAPKREPLRATVVDEPPPVKPALTKPVKTPPPPKPREVHRYSATVQLIAKQTVEVEVSATSLAEAAKQINKRAGELVIEPESAVLTRTVSKPRRM